MNPTIIRFPTAARLGAMATPVPWYVRLKRWVFGHRRRTWNNIKFSRERRGRP